MDRLRRGRVSLAGARYFVTVCTRQRKAGLNDPMVEEGIRGVLRELHRSGDLQLHCATVMPDHVHTLFTLGIRFSLGQTQSKFKAATKTLLEKSELAWQDNFYDHRIRHQRNLESFARYLFLNPYRKGLIPSRSSWPGWVINREYHPEFLQHLEEGNFPPAGWVAQKGSVQDLIDQDSKQEESGG